MVSKPLDVNGSLKQRRTHLATLRDIRQDSLPKEGRNRLLEDLFSCI